MATTKLITLTQLKRLEDRYPFNEEELEILVRCHERLKDREDDDDFLMKLALSSPYSYFFLPGDEMRDRVNWIEDHLLPPGFASEFRAAVSADPFVEYANQGEDKSLERFLEGIADTGRRGTREALRILYKLLGADATSEGLIDLCVRTAVAREALVIPNLDKNVFLKQLDDAKPAVRAISDSLEEECYGKPMSMKVFVHWAEDTLPMLSTPLSSFVHSLLFHGHPYPESRTPYVAPRLEQASDIFPSSTSPLLMSLSFMSQHFGGKWHRLYSSEMTGESFNRLEHSLLGYGGPTLLVVKTKGQVTLGAFASQTWKDSKHFYGTTDCFLFQLDPKVSVFRPTGQGKNFMYLHSGIFGSSLHLEKQDLPRGIGFGGTPDKPRLFIPESFEECSAEFLDKTFESGDLLPLDALEKFEIQCLEVWGVGGDQVIVNALRARSDYREITDTAVFNARVVRDRSQFAKDMRSGLLPSKVFEDDKDIRGRPDFVVDEDHGGYKLERE